MKTHAPLPRYLYSQDPAAIRLSLGRGLGPRLIRGQIGHEKTMIENQGRDDAYSRSNFTRARKNWRRNRKRLIAWHLWGTAKPSMPFELDEAGDAIPPFNCPFCGRPSWIDPTQHAPADYCTAADHLRSQHET